MPARCCRRGLTRATVVGAAGSCWPARCQQTCFTCCMLDHGNLDYVTCTPGVSGVLDTASSRLLIAGAGTVASATGCQLSWQSGKRLQ